MQSSYTRRQQNNKRCCFDISRPCAMGKTLEECYEVLGLDYCATEDEIKSAYRQKALKCHPDKNPDDPLSTQKFQELGHAYRRLMGDEDSDDDGDYDDNDDMDLWRDFFFFLFREEIMARVQCKCNKCGSRGDEDDDFLASLAKEQEERQQFTEEEMAQFTSFANLKEQKEANKQKFCNKNMSSCKPEQKINKGHKPKLKSSKQLKHEQWKREKEITEIAAQINQNPNLQEKKVPKKKNLHQHQSSIKPVAVKPEHIVKEQTDPVTSNKRNTRKKRNRNKSKKQEDQETESNQNYQSSSHRNTTFCQQKVASSFVQDAGRNVTIKPETTRRQDDVTGRLPRHTGYTSPRMTQSCAGNSAFSNHRNTPQNSERGYQFEYPKLEATSRPASGANFWHKRQQKQQFLAELQPTNQTDEELQLQIALEMSRKQAEIDAQQREISILEKQMEETLQIENNLQLKTVENEDGRKTATLSAETINIDDDSFPPLGVPLRAPLGNKQGSDVDEEWILASGSDEGWGDYNNVDDEPEEWVTKSSGQEWGNNACDDDDEAGRCVTKCSEEEWGSNTCDNDDDEAKGCLAKCSDVDEEHLKKETTSSIDGSERNDTKLLKPDEQLPQQFREEGSQASNSCPYGKNCCLGKRCKYSHPVSIDKRKRHRSFDNSSGSQDKCDITKSESRDENNTGHILPGEHSNISIVASYEGLVKSDNPDVSYPVSSNGRSRSTSITDFDDSITNNTLQASQPETSVTQLNKSSIQSYSTTGILENANQSLINDIPGLESQEDESSATQETPKTNSAISDEMKPSISSDAIESVKNETTDPCENSGDWTEESVAHVPPVNWVAKSSFPATLPATGDLKQSATTMLHFVDLSAAAKVQNSSQRTSQPVNYVKPLPGTVSSAPDAQSSGHTALIPGTLPGASQNTAILSVANTPQTSESGQQSSTLESNTPAQPVTTNNVPAMPSFPSLPCGNFLPFLNPANVATFNQNANASLLVAASLGGMPLPIIPGLSNSVQNPQGGGTVLNPGMPPPYGTKTASGSAVATPGYYLPIVPLNGFAGSPAVANMSGLGPQPLQPLRAGLAANTQATAQAMLQVNGLSGMPMVASMQAAGPRPLQPLQLGLVNNTQSTSQVMPQLHGSSGTPLGPGAVQPSQSVPASNPQSSTASIPQLPEHGFAGMPNMLGTGLTSIPQSTPLNMSQLFRVPFPFNPQALVNLNAQMTAMVMPYLTPQNGCQTTMKSQSGLDSSLVQVNGKSTEMDRVEQVVSKAQKPAEKKAGIGDERESSGVGSKAPSLRRPSTVPKVIQHQASI